MSTQKFTRAVQQLTQWVNRIITSLSRKVVDWLLRGLLAIGRQPLLNRAGFVLPTTVLLVLVLTLTVGSIGFRTYTRSQQTIGERQQRVIYNSATPAIDRAKAKIEYLFDARRDTRFPSGIPSENWLLGMMYNDGRTISVGTESLVVPTISLPDGSDPYTFPGESRVDAGGDAGVDNAWLYREDTNEDGTPDATVVYSILFSTPTITESGGTTVNPLNDASRTGVEIRAAALQVRHGPLSNANQTSAGCALPGASLAPEKGWIPDIADPSTLRKNFQVNVFVQPDAANGTVTTLEFHQDRQVNRGNRWGAWFRNDLEIFPGPQFNWNGAMHTEGNLIIGNNSFDAYMISSPYSCFYTKDASEVTVTDIPADPTNDVPAFQGQFLSGKVGDNSFGNNNDFHLFDGVGRPPITNAPQLTRDRDSVNPNTGGPADFALDPVIVQTADNSVSRNVDNPAARRWDGWLNTDFITKGRMRNLAQRAPYVDDVFRADNRYGPKPRYNEPIPGVIGTEIGNIDELVRDAPPAGSDASNVGLDGYWERRANYEGARIIVGQRLELGDPLGWGGPRHALGSSNFDEEPLRPWQTCPANARSRCHEARQRKTLWDNLAAVQATAVYHSANNTASPNLPIACLSSTVHPGTPRTLTDSSTFADLAFGIDTQAFGATYTSFSTATGGTRSPIISDFFRGLGTNGWEFEPPTIADFNQGTPMMNALNNLAHFAGDPRGGAPSFTPFQDNDVHPYPSMAMWGDFSMLRRVIDKMQSGTGYSALSPADQTVLHTAACSMGMLAYNLDYLEKLNIEELDDRESNPDTAALLGTHYADLQRFSRVPATPAEASSANNAYNRGLRGVIRRLRNGNNPLNITIRNEDEEPETYIRLMERWRNTLSGSARAEMEGIISLARLIITKEQVARDRGFGFFEPAANRPIYGVAPLGHCALWRGVNPWTGTESSYMIQGEGGTAAVQVLNGGTPVDKHVDGVDSSIQMFGEPLAYLCSARPHYPLLYSLFPALDTADAATSSTSYATPSGVNLRDLSTHNQSAFDPAQIRYTNFEGHTDVPNTQLGIARDAEDSFTFASYLGIANSGYTYQVIQPSQVLLQPQVLSGWRIPNAPATNGSTPNNNRDTLIRVCAANCTGNDPRVRIGFKDSAPYNGRELMVSRMMNINLDLLRRTTTNFGNTDYWLPRKGIIYAFREDAVSEREIVRPTNASWSSCNDEIKIRTTTSCRMNASGSAYAAVDPPLNENNSITPKPVDYLPDPDRRPFGFRLMNGKILGRPGDEGRGLSFITDNPVYLQGDFNCHLSSGNNCNSSGRMEEFYELLTDNFSNFYSRRNLNPGFARPNTDQWRPSEILADAISIISDDFCDGSIEDTYLTAGTGSGAQVPASIFNQYGCSATDRRTSYLNQTRPNTMPAANSEGVRWVRANLGDSLFDPPGDGDGSSPIMVDRQGNPMILLGTSVSNIRSYGFQRGQEFYPISDAKPLQNGIDNTRVNAIIISGLVPSQINQSYGGLHNFPRFLENWGSRDLFISGSFLQLNFSNQATGAFDQDAWEPNQTPVGGENIRYYSPPNRRWGYDVGLQYAPAGPVAARFVTALSVRSEFYNEPAANDPYIAHLCLQIPGNTSANCE